MKTFILVVIALAAGTYVGSQYPSIFSFNLEVDDAKPSTADDSKKPLYWVAPMDKNYRRDEPGQSPMGMDLVPVYEEDVSSDSSVKISAVVENNLGVETSPVKIAKLKLPINTVGTVNYDESRISHVHSRVEGWIETLNVSAKGDPIRKGQVLFELYSPALVSAQEEYLAALRSRNGNLIRASNSRLLSLGITQAQIDKLKKTNTVDQRIQYLANSDGIVLALNVRKGMFIKPMTEVLAIGTLDSVWVIGSVFERQAYQVRQGQDVEVTLESFPDKTWYGNVNYVYPELDPRTRTLSTRIRVPNLDHILKPNMLAHLSIANQATEASTVVPRAAVIKAGNHTRVVKALGGGRYQSVLVNTGFEGLLDDNPTPYIQINSGLTEGDSVVTSAQFLIDSESNIDAELSRINSETETQNSASKPTGNAVKALAKIEKLMASTSMITVTHEPIPAWDWPTMKMDFQVEKSIDLSKLSIGQEVELEIEKLGDWDFQIIDISTQPSVAMDHSSMDHSLMKPDVTNTKEGANQ
jgi:Cu(I)/Ag(I) efflux system membrane fusion protein